MWLGANDVIVGVALAVYVRDNAASIRSLTTDLVEVHVLMYLRELLSWLNSWPMGIKLNSEVAGLICRAFLFLSRVWEEGAPVHASVARSIADASSAAVLKPTLANLPVKLIGCAGFLGASSLLALAADLVSLLTLPFFACYVTATLVYRWSLRSLSALFNVFRGAPRCLALLQCSRKLTTGAVRRPQVQPAAKPCRARELRRRRPPARHDPLCHAELRLPDARRFLRRVCLGPSYSGPRLVHLQG